MRGVGGRAERTAVAALALAAVASAPTAVPPLSAQTGGSAAALDSIAAAVDSGRVDSARETLARWMERRFADAPSDVRARARLLQGRLAESPDEARRAYALVAVDGGAAGARARLRLAQLHLAEGRHQRALEELATVRADAPGGGMEAESWLWTGRVREASGEGEGACEAYRRASRGSTFGEAPEEARLRRAISRAVEACRRGEGTPAWRGRRAGGGDGDAAAAERRFAVQLGAFASRESAETLRRRAADAGFEARVTGRDPADALMRVRVGGFDRRSEAEELAGRLEDAGFSAIVVEIGRSGDES